MAMKISTEFFLVMSSVTLVTGADTTEIVSYKQLEAGSSLTGGLAEVKTVSIVDCARR